MLKVLIFGGSGLIGERIRQLLAVKYQIFSPTHLQVDVTNKEQVEQIIEKLKPDYIIYATGQSSQDQAEQDPKIANLLNSQALGFIAKLAASVGILILYFSTDAVFDGSKSDKPYLENDKTGPIYEYGKSKLLGEQVVMEASSRNCIARVIMVYSPSFSKRKRFVQIVLETLKKGKNFCGVVDQVVNPIYVDDVVWAVDSLIESKSYGIYHLGAKDYITNYEFVKKIAKAFNLDENLVSEVSLKEFSKKRNAPINQFCWLDTSKFRKKFGENILHSTSDGIGIFKSNLDL